MLEARGSKAQQVSLNILKPTPKTHEPSSTQKKNIKGIVGRTGSEGEARLLGLQHWMLLHCWLAGLQVRSNYEGPHFRMMISDSTSGSRRIACLRKSAKVLNPKPYVSRELQNRLASLRVFLKSLLQRPPTRPSCSVAVLKSHEVLGHLESPSSEPIGQA